MKKFASTNTAYNSGTSSETSETQSVEENQTYNLNNTFQNASSKIPKSRMRIKETVNDSENDSKRPPWRSVSVSTLPKPDKNAILRAKLLDASRRLRVTKITVGVQTDDVSSILMRDVSVGAQTDLILFKETGILTDGTYTKCRDGDQEYVLTYSVSLSTDTMSVTEAATQTLLPKVRGDAFLKAYLTDETSHNPDLIQECTNIQQKLLQQIKEIRESRKSLFKYQENVHGMLSSNDSYRKNNKENNAEINTSNFHLDQNNLSDDYIKFQQRPSLLQRTDKCWHFNDIRDDDQKLQLYTITPRKPWNSFVPFSFYKCQPHDWNLLLLAIDELVNESSHLADLIEDRLKREKQRRLNCQHEILSSSSKLNEFVPVDFKLPSEYWLPIIEEQEKELAELTDFKPIDIKEYEKFLKEC